MRRQLSLFSFFLLCVIVYSCSKSNETDLRNDYYGTPEPGCDTTNMSFVTDIKPILESNCYSCHSNTTYMVSGAKLEDYHDVLHHVEDGDLLGTITHASGYPAMPQGAAKLSSCDINKIKAWVDAGAVEN